MMSFDVGIAWPTGFYAQCVAIAWCEAFSNVKVTCFVIVDGRDPAALEAARTTAGLQAIKSVLVCDIAPPELALTLCFEPDGGSNALLVSAEELRTCVNASSLVGRAKEVWVSGGGLETARSLLALPTREAPHLWSPLPLLWRLGKARCDVSYPAARMKLSRSKLHPATLDVVVLVDAGGAIESALVPLLACKALTHVRAVVMLSETVLSSSCQELLKAAAGDDVAAKLKFINSMPVDVVPYFMRRAQLTAFISHHTNTALPPWLLCDLAWCGFPVVHNVRDFRAGMQYEGSIGDAAAQLSQVTATEAVLEANREALARFLPPSAAAFITEQLEASHLPPAVMPLLG